MAAFAPLVALVLAAQAAAQGTADMGCLLKHCPGALAKASVDPNFIKEGVCQVGCAKVLKEDTTPGKLHYQNCTTTCALTYDSPAGEGFLKCAMDNNCIGFPAIPGSCPYRKEHIQSDASLASLSGEFWQERGYNALWDCYPCQHIHEMKMVNDKDWCAKTVGPDGPVQAPCWSYSYSYDLYIEGDKTKYFGQTWQLPGNIPKGEPIEIYYTYMGSTHNETWYIFKATDNYVLLGDRPFIKNRVNVGSIVWVRPGHELTDAENKEIKAVYKDKLNIDYDGFCYDTHGPDKCVEPGVVRQQRPRGYPRPFLHPDDLQKAIQLLV